MYSQRKMKLMLVAIITMLAIMVTGVSAGDYYVATDGSDTTGDGSSGNPWQTISYALSHVSGSSRST